MPPPNGGSNHTDPTGKTGVKANAQNCVPDEPFEKVSLDNGEKSKTTIQDRFRESVL